LVKEGRKEGRMEAIKQVKERKEGRKKERKKKKTQNQNKQYSIKPCVFSRKLPNFRLGFLISLLGMIMSTS
jgi:hypothetical protein